MSGIAPDVTKNDLEDYFAKIGNAEVADVQFSLKTGVAMVVFDVWPGMSVYMYVSGWFGSICLYSMFVEQVRSFQTFTVSNRAPERVTLNWRIPLP